MDTLLMIENMFWFAFVAAGAAVASFWVGQIVRFAWLAGINLLSHSWAPLAGAKAGPGSSPGAPRREDMKYPIDVFADEGT